MVIFLLKFQLQKNTACFLIAQGYTSRAFPGGVILDNFVYLVKARECNFFTHSTWKGSISAALYVAVITFNTMKFSQ